MTAYGADSNPSSAAGQLGRFALVGTLGFLVDAAILLLALWLDMGLYAGRIISFLGAATATWYLNRKYTFASRNPKRMKEWASFLSANTAGGMVNYFFYACLVTCLTLFNDHPILAVAAGSLAGMALNFSLSRTLVFHERK